MPDLHFERPGTSGKLKEIVMDKDEKEMPAQAPAAPKPASQKPAPKDEGPVRYNDWASI